MKLSREWVKLEKRLRTSLGTLLLTGWEDKRILRRVAPEVEGHLKRVVSWSREKPANRALPAALSAVHI